MKGLAPNPLGAQKIVEEKAERKFVFADEYTAIMNIQAKKHYGPVRDIFKERIDAAMNEHRIEDYFFGISFGRFNYAVEFVARSAKIASNVICDIEDCLAESLKQKWKDSCLCSSAIFGTEVLHSQRSQTRFDQTVRAYSFIRPLGGEITSFMRALEYLNNIQPKQTQIKLLWTHGVHWVLVFSAPCFDGVLEKLERFRAATKNGYSETSTLVSLNYKNNLPDGKDRQTQQHRHSLKYAIAYIKQSDPVPLDIETIGLLKPFRKLPRQIKRLGGTDTVIVVRERTLRKIMKDLIDLRTRNIGRIEYTSTILLYWGENEKIAKAF